MTLIKQAGTAALAFVLTLLMFSIMQVLISNDGIFEKPSRESSYLNFIRLNTKDAELNTKDRRLPEPPPPPEEAPETPEFAAQIDSMSADLSMNLPTIGIPINSGDGPYLGALTQGDGLAGFDTDVIPVVRVQPAYPRRAKQAGIEGFVTMEVLIRADGTVTRAKVMESDPPRLFDEAALRAIERWKFRPKIVDGTPVSQRAKQTIEFTLQR
jgi:protein TonB